MPPFESIAETRRLGSPIVRLFRVALGRDPDPAALVHYASRLRRGEGLEALARDIVQSDEFRLRDAGLTQRRGARRLAMSEPAGSTGDRDRSAIDALPRSDIGDDPTALFAAQIAANAFPAGAVQEAARENLLVAAHLGMDAAGMIAILADSPLARENIPLLPGLAPGAPPDDPTAYRLWVEAYDNVGEAGLGCVPPLDGPLVSIVMAAGDTTLEDALRSAESLRRQTYGNWELLLAVRLFSAWPAEAAAAAADAEPRLRVLKAPKATEGHATGQQAAASAARGQLICFLDPGDTLAPTALHEVVAAFTAQPQAQLLYTDEDVGDAGGRHDPRLKPDFSPDLLLAGNSIGQLAVYRAPLLDRLGGLRPEMWPSAHHELALRAMTLVGADAVFHLPAVLCHRLARAKDWPTPVESIARLEPTLLAAEPALRAVEVAAWPRLRFRLPDPPPLVSVIVPTRDRGDLLAACIAGVLDRTDYRAIELLVVDNDSREPETLALLASLEATPKVRVLRRPGDFNFAALNNAAAAEASGEVILLLNNDTEVLHPDWLEELVSHAVRPDVGLVGACLLYPDGRLQHGGMLLGPAGAAIHVGRFAAHDVSGYDGQLACTRDLSAVTGACVALRRDVFWAVGGMEERLAVAWNDVDLCLRVREAGLRVIWTPHAVLRHHEAVSRGLEADDPAKLARFRDEQAFMRKRWKDKMEVDPFLNPNLLASEAGPLVLTRPRTRRPWQA